MPRVPTYDTPTVAPQPLPGAQMTDSSHLMQWATLGSQEQRQFGNAVQGVGKELAQIAADQQATINEAAVKDQHAQLVSTVSDVLHGSQDDPASGFMTQAGKNAIDGYSGVRDALTQLPDKMAENLQNPRQQQMFKQAAQQTVQAAITQASAHAAQQTQKYEIEASAARAQAAGDAAVKSFNPMPGADNTLYAQGVATQRAELENQADKFGLVDKERDEFIRQGLSATYVGVINHLAANDQIKAAKAYMATVQDDIDAKTQDKIRAVLEAGDTKNDSLALAIDIKGRIGGIAAQEKELDQQFKAGTINADVHDMALQKLRADNAQRRSEQSEADKAVIGQVWDLKNKQPGATLADLSPQTIAYVKQRGLGSHIDSILAGSPALDDAKLYNDMMRMSADDPVGFTKMDLSTVSGQLSQSHWNHLVGVQTSISRQDTKAMEANKLQHDTIAGVKANLLAAGFNLSPKPGTSQSKDLEQFETNLRDRLVQSMQDKNGPLSQDEARGIALGMLKDQALAGTGIGGFFQTHAPVWKMTPEQINAPWVVPDTDKQQIAQALKAKGRPVTDDAIQAIYKAKQLKGK